MSRLTRLLRDDRGASAVEFALVLPGLLLLTVGAIYMSFMMYAASTLHYATEEAARCRSIKLGLCTDATSTQTYALARYRGPNIGVSFVATQPTCGNQVVGTGTYKLRTGLRTLSVPLQATACFP